MATQETLIDIEAAWARSQQWYPTLSRATFEDARRYMANEEPDMPEEAWEELARHELGRDSPSMGWIVAAELVPIYIDQVVTED